MNATMSVAGLVAGIWMTIASGGHADTPLIAVGPLVLLLGLFAGYLSLSSRHAQLKVGDGSYTTRGGVVSKTKALQFSDVQMIRGGTGDTLACVVVTDRLGQRTMISLQRGPAKMRQYFAANLLSSSADIDPERSYALQQLAGDVKPVRAGPPADPFIRLDSHDQLRWRRGTASPCSLAHSAPCLACSGSSRRLLEFHAGGAGPFLPSGSWEWHFPLGESPGVV
jgi:hypothetical protein